MLTFVIDAFESDDRQMRSMHKRGEGGRRVVYTCSWSDVLLFTMVTRKSGAMRHVARCIIHPSDALYIHQNVNTLHNMLTAIRQYKNILDLDLRCVSLVYNIMKALKATLQIKDTNLHNLTLLKWPTAKFTEPIPQHWESMANDTCTHGTWDNRWDITQAAALYGFCSEYYSFTFSCHSVHALSCKYLSSIHHTHLHPYIMFNVQCIEKPSKFRKRQTMKDMIHAWYTYSLSTLMQPDISTIGRHKKLLHTQHHMLTLLKHIQKR